MKWVTRTFATINQGVIGPAFETGATYGGIGVHRHDGEGQWIVTDLASGYALGMFRTRTEARAIATAIAPNIPDRSVTDLARRYEIIAPVWRGAVGI